MKGCDILSGSRLHQAVHNELKHNKIQMLSQVNTSFLSEVNQMQGYCWRFSSSMFILYKGILYFTGT